jgi:hypothetical protein
MNLARRLSKLEHRRAVSRPPRIVMRYAGPGSEDMPPAQYPIDENAKVLTIRFVRTETATDDNPRVSAEATGATA